jgi:DNA-binding response OmpR family regulator
MNGTIAEMTPKLANTEAHMNQARVLIVEDEPFIAFDLIHAVGDAGSEPVGPASTIQEALALIHANGIKAAILDVDLPDGHIGPVLEALRSTVPIVIHTGVGLPSDVKARFPHVPVFFKPTPPAVLAEHLSSALTKT